MNNKRINLVILLFFLMLCSHVSLAEIDIKSREVDLGRIIQGTPISYIFLLKNPESKPLHIRKIAPD